MEQLGFFTGLGVVILFVAALVLGRFTVIGAGDKSAAARAAPVEGGAVRGGATTSEPVPAGSASATQTSRRATGFRTASLVPVFRGKQRSTAANAAAGRAAAEADVAAGNAR